MTPCVWRNSATRALYFTQPPNLSTAAHRNQKCTEFGMTAFGCNRMSIENAHLCTFGTETETKAEIRSTSTVHLLVRHGSTITKTIEGTWSSCMLKWSHLIPMTNNQRSPRRLTKNSGTTPAHCIPVDFTISEWTCSIRRNRRRFWCHKTPNFVTLYQWRNTHWTRLDKCQEPPRPEM